MDDFMDYIAYNIFIGNGKEFGFDDESEEEMLLESEEQESKPKFYDNNSSEGNSREY